MNTSGARMTRVQANFVRLEIVWLVLIAAAAVIALIQRGRPILWSAARSAGHLRAFVAAAGEPRLRWRRVGE